jgi:seryl-tRNA synthetase
MLDLKYIRENAEAVQENSRNRGVEADVGLVVELADRRSALIQELNELRQRQNQMARSIGKEQDPESRDRLIAESRAMKDRIPEKEADLSEVERRMREELLKIPNMTHPDAPIGKDDSENVEIRRWGEIPDFDFDIRDHVELGESLGIIDFDAGAKVAGSKFYFLRGDAVLLELGLVRYAMDILTQLGYQATITPDLARDEMLVGTGFIPRGPETQIYSVEDSDLSLIATSEIPLAGSLADEIVEENELPIRLAGLSHCFRTEAGSHGRASRGLYRVHQFTKVEMFAFTTPELSEELHAEMLDIEERIFQGLGLPYRVVDICTGDLGGAAYRKFDLEAWMPGRNDYGEVTSTSNTTDYQARRLRIRYRRDGGRPQLLHTLEAPGGRYHRRDQPFVGRRSGVPSQGRTRGGVPRIAGLPGEARAARHELRGLRIRHCGQPRCGHSRDVP